MAESERLAMQLMQEEETLLCERIQQEQMRVIAEMRRNRRLSGGDRTESNDLDVALRLAEVGLKLFSCLFLSNCGPTARRRGRTRNRR